MKFQFKQINKDVNQRKLQCDNLRNQFPDKIPIICEKDTKYDIKDTDKTRYLVPQELTISQFNFMIRKRLKLSQEDAFFLLANGKYSLTGDTIISDIYERYKDKEDGFLYITYANDVFLG